MESLLFVQFIKTSEAAYEQFRLLMHYSQHIKS